MHHETPEALEAKKLIDNRGLFAAICRAVEMKTAYRAAKNKPQLAYWEGVLNSIEHAHKKQIDKLG